MPTIVDTAICIRCWDFSETSQTVSLLSRDHGILRGLAKGAKREKGGFSGGLDVLTRGEVVANIKPGGELALITAWHLQDMFRWVRQSLAVNRAALYMADLAHHMLAEHDPHPALFDGLVKALEQMSDAALTEPALLRFQWLLLREAGYNPQLDRDAQTGALLPHGAPTMAFSAKHGGIVADSGGPDRWRVRTETVNILRMLDQMQEPQGEADAVRRANRLLAAYFRELIGSEPPAMRWAFSDFIIS